MCFRSAIDVLIPKLVMNSINCHATFFDSVRDMYKTFQIALESVEDDIENAKTSSKFEIEHLKKTGQQMERECIENIRRLEQGAYTDLQILQPKTGEKEGYLYRKTNNSWTFRFYMIKNGGFSYITIGTSGRNRGKLMSTTPENVLLCNVRVSKTEERRFCFEITSPSKGTYVLQADSEMEMKSWIGTFEHAKYLAADFVPVGTVVQPQDIDDRIDMYAENDDGEILHNLERTSVSSRTEKNTSDVARTSQVSLITNGSNSSTSSSLDGVVLPPNALDLEVDIDETVFANEPDVIQSDIKYASKHHERSDTNMHQIFKSLAPTDHFICSFSVAYNKDVPVQGRLFVTANRLCFYSNIFNMVTIFTIRFKDVSTITRKQGTFQGSINISTREKSYTFKNYGKNENVFVSLNKIWHNAISLKPLPAQDLYDMIEKQNTKSANEKKDATLSGDLNEATDTQGEGTNETKNTQPEKEGTISNDNAGEYDIPSSLKVPTAQVACGCSEHVERMECDIVLPCTAKKAFDVLFGSKAHVFWTSIDSLKEGRCRKGTQWTEGAEPVREWTFILPMNNPLVKLKEIDVKETHHILKREEWIVYVAEVRVFTPQVPFGDCFNTVVRYCLTWVSKDTCRLVVHSGFNFSKSTMMKNFIKSNATKPLSEGCQLNITELKKTIGGVKQSAGDDKKDIALNSAEAQPTNSTAVPSNSHKSNDSLSGQFSLYHVITYVIVGIVMTLFITNFRARRIEEVPKVLHFSRACENTYQKVEIPWKQEMETNGIQPHRFRQFFKEQFGIEASGDIPSRLEPYIQSNVVRQFTDTKLSESHADLIHRYHRIESTRSEINGIFKELQEAEMHLVMSMFYNWYSYTINKECGIESNATCNS